VIVNNQVRRDVAAFRPDAVLEQHVDASRPFPQACPNFPGVGFFHFQQSLKSRQFALKLREAVLRYTRMRARTPQGKTLAWAGGRFAPYYGALQWEAPYPVVLVESGFICDPADQQVFSDPAKLSDLAFAYLAGLHAYLGLPPPVRRERKQEQPVPEWGMPWPLLLLMGVPLAVFISRHARARGWKLPLPAFLRRVIGGLFARK